jgi:23S rRNA (uridine2552-2'-O)-methyltransferase
MGRTKSSKRWLKEHFSDDYVQKAQQTGYRSRAVYKLQEINQKDTLLRTGMTVVDLGAAPGGWSQLAAEIVGEKGKVIAVDILSMDPIPGVEIQQGDFTTQEVYENVIKILDGRNAGLVMSDMAPNISGIASVDQARAMYLAELSLDLARKVLVSDGDFLVKVFQGSGFDELKREMGLAFKKVVIRKPKASRSRSREVYMVARGYNL